MAAKTENGNGNGHARAAKLSSAQDRVLELLRKAGKAGVTEWPGRTPTRSLHVLREMGLAKSAGRGKASRWAVTPKGAKAPKREARA